jgi:NTP pyrophosphatase (non-canonical NTP hydrolase)
MRKKEIIKLQEKTIEGLRISLRIARNGNLINLKDQRDTIIAHAKIVESLSIELSSKEVVITEEALEKFILQPKLKDLNSLCARQFDWVERMGWHNKSVLEALALIASEVGEASDELDWNDPIQAKMAGISRSVAKAVNCCRHTEPTENFKVELADICLRVFDLSHSQGINLEKEVLTKMEINEARGTRGRLK